MRGKFIVIEGIDGTGKSTLIQALREHWQSRNFPAVWVRDPGSTPVSTAIRQLLLDPRHTDIAPLTELLLYCASRAQLLQEVILPALDRGEYVFSDRFFYSTLAYQGAHHILPQDELRSLVLGAAQNLTPDFVFLLDAPAAVSMARIQRAHDRMENRGVEYMETVRQLYLQEISALAPARRIILDATRPAEAVREEALSILEKFPVPECEIKE